MEYKKRYDCIICGFGFDYLEYEGDVCMGCLLSKPGSVYSQCEMCRKSFKVGFLEDGYCKYCKGEEKMSNPAEQKCIVRNCENHKHQGRFIGDLCLPCYEYITTNIKSNSQACRNAIESFDCNDTKVQMFNSIIDIYKEDGNNYVIKYIEAYLKDQEKEKEEKKADKILDLLELNNYAMKGILLNNIDKLKKILNED